MRKFLLTFRLLWGSFFGYNVCAVVEENTIDAHEEGMILVFLGYGNAHLLNHEFSLALHDFQKASQLMLDSGNIRLEIEFLISFGKAIAYDNLKLENEC